ncbi:hypothetical protein M758_1G326400 [Ceratodon purpureus]|nr:hypothetical protein M758_1G326400 [Ceratodon purpureus]
MSRKEKRKELKKLKRKQLRREAALVSAQGDGEEGEGDEEAVIQGQREEEEALARERAAHDEQERLWLLREEEARKEWLRKQEEDAERKRQEEERSRKGEDGEEDLEEGWEYVEDGPAEIIWKGNEIIVKKPRKKVRKGTKSSVLAIEQDKNGPTSDYSNPLPPQSSAFSSYQANIQDVADQSTNFGTEQDKTNCPFYIKQGVCRFGVRCSRLHPVFNDACTLLMRSMYTGAGLALEPVESLEFTDEEVVQEYEEFYDDVHSEFLQFGEIVNFKVCRNSSPHLRGNVYVHYVSRESAVAAYNHMNGRFYAKKQISCEFVGVTKWKLAICGEFMRTYYKTCSRGTACNFLHCFENPRREYEWADVDRSPPRFWQRKMANLFSYASISGEDFDERQEKSRSHRESTHDSGRGRHRDDRELAYDDDRRKDRHSRETVREDDQRRGRGDRDRKPYEDELNDRSKRGSKSDDRQRVRHLKESSHDSRRRDSTLDEDDNHSHRRRRDSTLDEDDNHGHRRRRDTRHDDDPTRDNSTSRSRYGDEQGSINAERWSPGDDCGQPNDKGLVYYRDRRSDRRYRESTHDVDDEDNDDDHHSHSRSHRHRSRRRSRSPGSQRTRRSRSRDRSTPHRARSQDGYYSSEEQEYRCSKKEYASKESKRHRHDSQAGSYYLERKEDEDGQSHRKGRHSSRERWSYSENALEQSVKVLESDDSRSRHAKHLEPPHTGLASDENSLGSLRKLEIDSGLQVGVEVEKLNQEADSNSKSTATGLSLELSTDDVQKSTSQWQSWRKTKFKKAKVGLKDAPMRIII